jgi:hypothetical protein
MVAHLIHINASFLCLLLLGIPLMAGSQPEPETDRGLFAGALECQQNFHLKMVPESDLLKFKLSRVITLQNRQHPGPDSGCHTPSQNKHKSQSPSSIKKESTKRFSRALLLSGILISVNSTKYWIKYSQWIEDWQFELTWNDQKRRWFSREGYKFDSNPFLTNWTHTLSGAIYFNFARYNRLSTLESSLFMLSTNLVWEFITEWREVISIGDNICTGIAGISIGEPLFWIGSYFTQKNGLLNSILGALFNPVVATNDILDKNKYRSDLHLERFSKPRFELFFGLKKSSFQDNDSTQAQFNTGIEVRYYTIEGYGEPGSINQYMKDTLFSEISGDIAFGANNLEEYSFFTRALLFGWFKQNLKQNSVKELTGYNYILGAGTAFDFFKKKSTQYYDKGEYHYDFEGGELPPQPTEFTDKLAVMNLIGPVFELSLYSGPFKLRTSVSAYFDFALINSLAINQYSTVYDLADPRIKTTLSYYGYYYALGLTLASDLEISYNNIRLQGKIKYQTYDSIDGLDRFQDELDDDSNVRDTRLIYKISLGARLSRSPVTLLLAYECIDRKGWFKDITHSSTEDRIFTQLQISL